MIKQNKYGGSKFLLGRKGFFFEPDNGANASGQTNQTTDDGQQQQQQGDSFKSPFEGIDRDLLDSQARDAIVKAEAQLKDLNGRANQTSQFQSKYDALQAQHDKALQSLQSITQQQQRQVQSKELSLEDELAQVYIENGLAPDQAVRAAKMQSQIQDKAFRRFQSTQDQRLAPIIGNVVDSNAQNAFQEAMNNDRNGLFKNESLRQMVWEKAQELSSQGQLVTAPVISNLARIFHFDLQDASQNNNGQQFQQQQQQNAPYMNQQTRFTYPGAGNFVKQPNQQSNEPAVDSETLAAMGATTSNWKVVPKQFKDFPKSNQVRITRGGI